MRLRRIHPSWIEYRPFWQELEERGSRVVVLDVPYTFPTSLQHGVEITDWGTHRQTWPLDSNRRDAAALLRRVGRSPLGRETPLEKSPAQMERMKRRCLASAAAKNQMITRLMKSCDWDVFLTVFGEAHRAGHLFCSDADVAPYDDRTTPLLEVYKATDRPLSRILEATDLGATRVLIFSLHGMTRDGALPELVRPLMRRVNEQFLQVWAGSTGGRTQRVDLVRVLRHLAPKRLEYAIASVSPGSLRQWVVEREIIGGLDWSQTPRFALRTDICTEQRFNLAGSEERGLLPASYEAHRSYARLVRDAFLDLRDAETGEPLINAVIEPQAVFPGLRRDVLPDVAFL